METLEILKTIVAIPRPSGYENSAKKCFIELVSPYVDNCCEDILGNVIVRKYGKTDKTIMLVAHIDEIGLVVSYIEENGFLRFNVIGGCNVSIFPGRKIIINHQGRQISGVIGLVPIHLQKQNSKCSSGDIDVSDMWIDIGTSCKKEAEQYVAVGDYIVFDTSLVSLLGGNITARGLDNAVGIVTLIEVLSKLPKELDYNICGVASVQEEIGLRGAMTATYTIQPTICIAVDVTHATDYPSINKSKYGDIGLGGGTVIPFGPEMTPDIQDKLRDIAKANQISYQTEVCPMRSGTDIHSVQVVRGGCATGLVSIPCRYMHTPIEVVSIYDIKSTIKILTDFCSMSV